MERKGGRDGDLCRARPLPRSAPACRAVLRGHGGRRALWSGHLRDPVTPGHFHRPVANRPAELRDPFSYGLHIADANVGEPMWRGHIRTAVEHSAVRLATLAEQVIDPHRAHIEFAD